MSLLSWILVTAPDKFFHIFPNRWVFSLDSFQYVDGWPSGYGVREALDFADRHRAGKNAFIGVRWDAGNPEDSVLLYASKLPGVTTSFFDKRLDEFPLIVEAMRNRPMYLITRNNQRGGLDQNLTLLTQFYKPAGEESVEVYIYKSDK